MVFIVTAKIRGRDYRTWYGKKCINWTIQEEEFDGGLEGLQQAINYCYNNNVIKIETRYAPDARREETTFYRLVSDFKWSAIADARESEREDLENKAKEEEIRAKIEYGTQHFVRNLLENALEDIMYIMSDRIPDVTDDEKWETVWDAR